MLPQSVKYGMGGITAISIGLQVILDSEQGPGVQGDASEPLSLTDDVNDRLVSISLEIPS